MDIRILGKTGLSVSALGGISGHRSELLARWLKDYPFETVLFHLNMVTTVYKARSDSDLPGSERRHDCDEAFVRSVYVAGS
jgi:hypothetical protein